jgi:hypothetical protein
MTSPATAVDLHAELSHPGKQWSLLEQVLSADTLASSVKKMFVDFIGRDAHRISGAKALVSVDPQGKLSQFACQI